MNSDHALAARLSFEYVLVSRAPLPRDSPSRAAADKNSSYQRTSRGGARDQLRCSQGLRIPRESRRISFWAGPSKLSVNRNFLAPKARAQLLQQDAVLAYWTKCSGARTLKSYHFALCVIRIYLCATGRMSQFSIRVHPHEFAVRFYFPYRSSTILNQTCLYLSSVLHRIRF